MLTAADQPVHLQHADIVDKVPELKHNLMKNQIVPRFLAYNVLSDEVFQFANDAHIPLNTLDNPVLEFEMASVKKREFSEFRKPLVASVTLEKVAKLLEPALKYDPLEHITHVRTTLDKSSITTQLEQQGSIYVDNFLVRADEMEMRIYEELADAAHDAESYHRLGDQYRLRQRYEVAAIQYRLALEKEAKHKFTQFNLASCLEYMGDYEPALASYRLAGALDPTDADVSYRLARTYLKMGNTAEAEKQIEQSLAMTKSESAYLLKARILEQMGRTDALIATYFQILALNPDNHDVSAALSAYLRKW